MNIRLAFLIVALIPATSDFAVAATMTFPKHNFTIEVPATWTSINPALPGTLFAVQSSDGEKVYFGNALSVSENKSVSRVLTAAIAGFKKARIDNNYRLVAERQQTLNDVAFNVFTSRGVGNQETATTWFASAGTELFILGGIHKNGDADTDKELLSIMSSFRLISPPQVAIHKSSIDSIAFWIGCISGVVVLLVFVHLKRSKNRKRMQNIAAF